MEDKLSCKIVIESKHDAVQIKVCLFENENMLNIQASLASLDVEQDSNPTVFELGDGSRSCREFLTEHISSQDPVMPPSKVG